MIGETVGSMMAMFGEAVVVVGEGKAILGHTAKPEPPCPYVSPPSLST